MGGESSGYVYHILASTPGGPKVKVGYSGDHPTRRWRLLQCGSPVPLYRWGFAPGTRIDERRLHRRFRGYRSEGEWFWAVGKMLGHLLTCQTPWITEADDVTDYELAVLSNMSFGKGPLTLGQALAMSLPSVTEVDGKPVRVADL